MDSEWNRTTHGRHWSFTSEELRLRRKELEKLALYNKAYVRKEWPTESTIRVFLIAGMCIMISQEGCV